MFGNGNKNERHRSIVTKSPYDLRQGFYIVYVKTHCWMFEESIRRLYFLDHFQSIGNIQQTVVIAIVRLHYTYCQHFRQNGMMRLKLITEEEIDLIDQILKLSMFWVRLTLWNYMRFWYFWNSDYTQLSMKWMNMHVMWYSTRIRMLSPIYTLFMLQWFWLWFERSFTFSFHQ